MQVNGERKTVPKPVSPNETSFLVCDLAVRERHREEYLCKRDPILDDRLLCRAQSFRHTVHLLPGESILELGCGGLHFTRALLRVSHRGNPITSVTFQTEPPVAWDVLPEIELIQLREFPGGLAGDSFFPRAIRASTLVPT